MHHFRHGPAACLPLQSASAPGLAQACWAKSTAFRGRGRQSDFVRPAFAPPAAAPRDCTARRDEVPARKVNAARRPHGFIIESNMFTQASNVGRPARRLVRARSVQRARCGRRPSSSAAGAAAPLLRRPFRPRHARSWTTPARPARRSASSGGGRCNSPPSAPPPTASSPRIPISPSRPPPPSRGLSRPRRGPTPSPGTRKTFGQLFCDRSARDIIEMLTSLCTAGWPRGSELRTEIGEITHDGGRFRVTLGDGGPPPRGDGPPPRSSPPAGQVDPEAWAPPAALTRSPARFGLAVTDTSAGLVPSPSRGPFRGVVRRVAAVAASTGGARFRRGSASSPTAAYRSPPCCNAPSYWHEGTPVEIDLLPGADCRARRSPGQGHPWCATAVVLARRP